MQVNSKAGPPTHSVHLHNSIGLLPRLSQDYVPCADTPGSVPTFTPLPEYPVSTENYANKSPSARERRLASKAPSRVRTAAHDCSWTFSAAISPIATTFRWIVVLNLHRRDALTCRPFSAARARHVVDLKKPASSSRSSYAPNNFHQIN
ncbi:hypothetical protein A0H81_12082 [Grifola frondosa]|uniref:Uncharacterized protein n=1 Tax=Grifola frondosa TaxID=5627 RepID=A0A1C7LV22_GRIFR|nr:hypothetical protein A0H81_12082 [Grifola frondosa]